MTSEVQSVVFKTDPPNKWTLSRAKQWLKEHGLKLLKDKKVDKTTNSLRFRINPPEKYIDFRTNVSEGKFGQINFIIGIVGLKSDKRKKRKKKNKRLMMKVE